VAPLLVLLLVAALGVGGYVYLGGSPLALAGCSGSSSVRVDAAPEIAPVVEKATLALEKDGVEVDGACVDYDVKAVAPEKVSQLLSAQSEDAPDLWVPDFSVWLTRIKESGAEPTTVAKSLAKSPVVVVSQGKESPGSWREVGMNTVAYLDPLSSSASTAALLSAFGEMAVTGATKTEMGAMMVPLAQRYGAQPNKPTKIEDVAKAAEQGAQGVMTEQQLVDLQNDGKAKGLNATVPNSGTMVLDYPLATLSSGETVEGAGSRIADFLASPRGADLLAAQGFRDPDNTPLAGGKGLGKGSVPELPKPKAEDVSGALRQWSVLTVPSRSLAVVDVSGSMDFKDGGRTRISLAVNAAQEALKLFPDNAQIGLWAFSVGLGGGNRDYTSLLPIEALGEGSQREDLAAAFAKLPDMTDGGTGLYDTTLAAIRTVEADYDARSVNTVILLTDGENDDPGSLRLKELIQAIERERDPARPVPVIAIGMGPDADAKALEKIAGATGGRSYVARNPSDIGKVFIDAMLSR
jgi:hypothetical protein